MLVDHLENLILIERTPMIVDVFEFGTTSESGNASILRSLRPLIIVVDDCELGVACLALVAVAALLLFNEE